MNLEWRNLGVLLGLSGLGFIARNFLLVLAPQVGSGLFLLPVMVAGMALTLWLLIKGVDVRKWEEKVTLHP